MQEGSTYYMLHQISSFRYKCRRRAGNVGKHQTTASCAQKPELQEHHIVSPSVLCKHTSVVFFVEHSAVGQTKGQVYIPPGCPHSFTDASINQTLCSPAVLCKGMEHSFFNPINY